LRTLPGQWNFKKVELFRTLVEQEPGPLASLLDDALEVCFWHFGDIRSGVQFVSIGTGRAVRVPYCIADIGCGESIRSVDVRDLSAVHDRADYGAAMPAPAEEKGRALADQSQQRHDGISLSTEQPVERAAGYCD